MSTSNSAQMVDTETAWYYENPGSIELIVNLAQAPKTGEYKKRCGARFSGEGYIHVRIPSRLLLATLERQGRAKPVKKSSRTRTQK